MPEFGEPWTTSGESFSERHKKPMPCSGLFDCDGILLGDAVMGLGYSESAEAIDQKMLERITACINACAGIPTEDLVSGKWLT